MMQKLKDFKEKLGQRKNQFNILKEEMVDMREMQVQSDVLSK